jgi:hypothetical protein
MTEKIRCPRCSAKLTKKIDNRRYNNQDYTLICKPCEKLHPYKGFRANHGYDGELKTLYTYFDIDDYKFGLALKFSQQVKYCPYKVTCEYKVSIYLQDKSGNSYSPSSLIQSFDGYDLIDQGVDVLDYDSLFSFFKKECRRWHKLKAFL